MPFLRKLILVIVVCLSLVCIHVIQIVKEWTTPEKPDIKFEWWGSGNELNEDKTIHPFKIKFSDEVLKDLKYRLEHTRTPSKPLENSQWYGFNGDLALEILDHWKNRYNFKKREQYLNQFPQFITSIQGLKIHFIHVKPQNISDNIKITPLLILHGWPGSLIEFYEIIPLLTTPKNDQNYVFEVIAPHLPGFAFSEASSKPGMGALEVSLILKNLMNRLGFKKFYVQGGDLGAAVLQAMSTNFEDNVLGFHTNMCSSFHPSSLVKLFLGALFPQWISDVNHQQFFYPLNKLLKFIMIETGYLHLHSTKPDSIGLSMDDSPMGLAAYILEKFVTGVNFDYRSRQDGGLKETFGYDKILDNIMLYWITKSATTAFRFYSETFNAKKFPAIFWWPINVPSACARFKYDIIVPNEILADNYRNLVQVNNYDGGHFAALQTPGILADDIFDAISKMEIINDHKT